VPLTAAPTLARLLAKVIDAGIVCLIAAAIAAVIWLVGGPQVLGPNVFPWLPVVCILGSVLGFVG